MLPQSIELSKSVPGWKIRFAFAFRRTIRMRSVWARFAGFAGKLGHNAATGRDVGHTRPPLRERSPDEVRPNAIRGRGRGREWRSRGCARPLGQGWGQIDIADPSSFAGLVSGSHLSYRRCPRRQRGKPSHPLKDRPVQPARHCDFGQLRRDVSGVMIHLRTDLDQLVPQGRERPLLHTRRQRQAAHAKANLTRDCGISRRWAF